MRASRLIADHTVVGQQENADQDSDYLKPPPPYCPETLCIESGGVRDR